DELFVLVDGVRHPLDELAALGIEASRDVLGEPAGLEIARMHARTGDELRQVEDQLALAEAVPEHRDRELILDLSELVAGTRMHTRYFQAGGLAEDVPRGFYPECRKFVERMPHGVDEYEELVNRNAIWLERTRPRRCPRTRRSRRSAVRPRARR